MKRKQRYIHIILISALLLFFVISFTVTFGPELMAMNPEDRSAVLSWMWENSPKRHLIIIAVMIIIAIVRKIRRKVR